MNVLDARHRNGSSPAISPADPGLDLSRADRVMVIAPHPDDEVLAAGCLLQQAIAAGAAVRILYLTSGENNPWAQLVNEGRWPRSERDRMRWAARRRHEALAGIECLGCSRSAARFLELPDQGLSNLIMRGDRQLETALAGEIEAWRPTWIASPAASDPHPDHSAAALCLEAAFCLRSAPSIAPRALFYSSALKQHRTRSAFDRMITPSSEAQARKRRAILCHVSQLRWHRARFLAVMADPEFFALAPTLEDPPASFTEAILYGDRLRVTFGVPGGSWRGPATLWIALDDPHGPLSRLVVRLPFAGTRARIHDSLRGQFIGHATRRRMPRGSRLELTLEMLPRASRGFVKLDHPVARRLGFVYDTGWRQITIVGRPSPVTPFLARDPAAQPLSRP